MDLPTRVGELTPFTQRVMQCMTGNASFPSPSPSLATIAAAEAELSSAQVAVQTRTRGTREVRDDKLKKLVGLLKRLKAYVQGVADDHPENAGSIIESSGFSIKKKGAYAKPPFAVKPGKERGSVHLAVRSAGDRAAYLLGVEPRRRRVVGDPRYDAGRHEIHGLPSGKLCLFRVRVRTPRGGEGDWSAPVELVVP